MITIRNVLDVYKLVDKERLLDEAARIIKVVGNGGIVYTPKDLGIDYANKVAEILTEKTGLKIYPLTSKNIKVIDKFANKEIDVVVGISTYYGVSVRGIDLPEVIKYVIFLEVPRHKISLDLENIDLLDIQRILELSLDIVDKDRRDKISTTLNKLIRLLRRNSPSFLKEVLEKVIKGKVESKVEEVLNNSIEVVKEILNDKELMSRLENNPYTKVIKQDGKYYIYLSDWATYIQASGRTSRLYVGGISKGLSIILETDPRLLNSLVRRLRLLSDEFTLHDLDSIDLEGVIREIEKDRINIIKAREGKLHEVINTPIKELTKIVLVIVESPNKARTIARFFGKPSIKEVDSIKVYEVSLGNVTILITASGGHIYDLAVDDIDNNIYKESLHGVIIYDSKYIPIYTTIKKCLNCGYKFEYDTQSLRCSICGSQDVKDSKIIVNALRKIALEADEIYIATDPDTEGEKIAFDILITLYPYNNKIKRIEFHEVTRKAFINSLKNPRDIDFNRVKAQFVRRIEDRWIGFILSQKVTEYVSKDITLSYRLSAGRVQTPVLGWIINSANEHRKKKFLILKIGEKENLYQLELNLSTLSRIPKVGERLNVNVQLEDTWLEELNPLPPYTTDSLLIDASTYLRIDAPKAMEIAQDLFEIGLITYHRTDSTRISDQGIEVAKRYLSDVDKQNLMYPRRWGEEGAHEAIRPTRPIDIDTISRMLDEGILDVRLSKDHLRIYDLIFRRFIASQSIPAKVSNCNIRFKILDSNSNIIGELVCKEIYDYIELGFLEFYRYPYRMFPKRLIGGSWDIIVKNESFKGDKLYTPGDLVRLMKQEGIGRPSTYSKIVEVILKRYIIKDVFKKTGYLIPNRYGRIVYEYLSKEYGDLVSVDRTRRLEEKMDLVEKGESIYEDIINDLLTELKNYNLI